MKKQRKWKWQAPATTALLLTLLGAQHASAQASSAQTGSGSASEPKAGAARATPPWKLPANVGLGPAAGAYRLLRYNDENAKPDTGPLAAWKNRPLTDSGFVTVSITGEERARGLYQRWSSYAGAGQVDQTSLLLRHQYSADLRFGRDLRLFGQLVSAQQVGENFSRPRNPRQRNDLDAMQLFAELSGEAYQGRTGLRIGRQQMTYGNGMIFALQAAPNIERNFDGLRAYYNSPSLKIDAFAMRPLAYGRHVFDDKPDATVGVWGLYASSPLYRGANASWNIDPFYVGLRDEDISLAGVRGNELVHSFGARLWGKVADLTLDYTFVYQHGDLNGIPVKAGAFYSSIAGSPFGDGGPEISLNLDVATGGRSAGGTINTYNQLYIAGEYASIDNYITPTNLYSAGPSITFDLAPKMSLELIERMYWRFDTADAVYGTNMAVLAQTRTTDARYVGQQPAADLKWQIDDHWQLRTTAAYFIPSSAMEKAGLRKTPEILVNLGYLF